MKNSSYYIVPIGDWTHDLPHTLASNMVNVSHALNHSATKAVAHQSQTWNCSYSIVYITEFEAVLFLRFLISAGVLHERVRSMV